MISVLLADDHKIMREGLKALLARSGDISVVAKAVNGEEAVEMAAQHQPDVIVMDMNMPGLTGIEATRRILETAPDIRILMLSMVMDHDCVAESLKAGAKGYLIKDCAAEELVTAIRALASGEAYLCSKITDMMLREFTHNTTGEPVSTSPKLSPREREVLQFIADGKNTKEIAFKLGVSAKTVDVQRMNLMKKLNLFSIAELTKYAVREGLTEA